MRKDERQNEILDLIREHRIATQEDLAARLEAKGFAVNQSSVSRDLIELGIVKANGKYVAPEARVAFDSIRPRTLEIAGESLIVGKTESGLASAVCVRIDNAQIEEIVGTIAGEDTIFIAVRGQKEQRIALKKVWELFGN